MELKEIYLEAYRLADLICKAFILHDEEKIEESRECFAQVYEALFPELPKTRIRKAADAIIAALLAKDKFDKPELSRRARFANQGWIEVYNHFLDFSRALGLPDEYAYYHAEFWRKHKGEKDYWNDCLAAEKIFGERVVESKARITKIRDGTNGPGLLAALYLVAVEGHDLRTKESWEVVRKAMEQYYKIILLSREGKEIALVHTKAQRKNV